MNPTWNPTSKFMNPCESLYRIEQSSALNHGFQGVRFNPFQLLNGELVSHSEALPLLLQHQRQ
ncbi:hypothetical protein A2U01_0063011, partial [Trifolium medium]|nr:hypothetical protein [Trifolium medium]